MAYGLLKGKKGIIFGALDHNSIAWKVAEQAHAEGAEFILTNAPIALRMGTLNSLAEKTGSPIVGADATSVEELTNLFQHASEQYGKLDFILHSIGMSPNVRKSRLYSDLNYEWYQRTLDVSALSFHKVMQTAWKADIMNEWGSVVALSYIAAQRTFGKYSDMAEAKAALESIARSFGLHFGKHRKVRVNTVSQSPTFTTAGNGVAGFDKMFKFADMMSPLGNATADECAAYCIMLFSDFSRKVTMQNLFHDGGFSTTGITNDLLDHFNFE